MIKEIHIPEDIEHPSLVNQMEMINFQSKLYGQLPKFTSCDLKYGALLDIFEKECSEREQDLMYLNSHFTFVYDFLHVDFQLYDLQLNATRVDIIKRIITTLKTINGTHLLTNDLTESSIKKLESTYNITF